MGIRIERYRTLAAVGMFMLAALVVARPTPAHAGSVLPFPGTEMATALRGVPTTGGLATVTRISGACPLIQCKIVGGLSIAFALYAAKDALVGAKQSGQNLIEYFGGEPEYPIEAHDSVITAKITNPGGGDRGFNVEWKCTAGWVIWTLSSSFYTCQGMQGRSNLNAGMHNGTPREADCYNTTTGVMTTRAITTSWGANMSKAASGGLPAAGTVITTGHTACNTGERADALRFHDSTVTSTWQGLTVPIGWTRGGLGDDPYPEGPVEFGAAVIQVDCKNAKTGATATMAKTSAWIDETLTIPSCKAKYGEDWYGTGLRIIPQDPTVNGNELPSGMWPGWGDGAVPKESWTPDGVTPEVEAMPCYSSGNGCSLTIWIDDEPVFPGEFSWSKIETYKDDDRATCHWGTLTVDWDNCKVLEGAFRSPNGQAEIDPYKPPSTAPEVVNPTVPEGVPVPEPVTPTPPSDLGNDFGACMAGTSGWNPFAYVYAGVKCALRWAFVPSPTSWGWEAFVEQIKLRPPTSIAVGMVTQMQAVATGFQGAGTCGVLADFGDGMQITCPAIRSIPGFLGLYSIVQVALVGLTGFTIFHMFRSVLGSEGNG